MGQRLEEKPGEELCGQRFLYEEKGGGAVIWRCFSYEERAEVPPRVGGLAVTGLAPYCFSAHMDPEILRVGVASGRLKLWPEGEEPAPELCGGRLRELALPQSVSHVGRYCLYNCGSLELLEFDGALSDWGSGVFTGCHRLARIRLCPDEEGRSSLKQVLDEVPEALEVELLAHPGEGLPEAVLVFPEFYEEGVENTPARILETHVHGSGLLYRNCFLGRALDFRQYDRLFPYAKAQESFELVGRMVTGRLWFPHQLSQAARQQYEDYARGEWEAFARRFVRERDLRGIQWLAGLAGEEGRQWYGPMAELAAREHFAEAVSFLMESRRASGAPAGRRRRLEL